jgi:hypothetical protein
MMPIDGAASDGATSAADNEGIDSELDRVEEEPGDAAADQPAGASEPAPPGGTEPAPDPGQPIPTIAPPGFPAGSAPRLVPMEFVGPVTGRAVLFNVYLPPGYDSGAASYPVLYDLHGLTDSRDTRLSAFTWPPSASPTSFMRDDLRDHAEDIQRL